MKKWPVSACILFLFFAFGCKKSNSPGNTPASSYYLSSVTDYSPQSRIIDSFTYDSSHRIARFAQYSYDTTSGSPVFYYWTADFTLPANGSAPSSYTYNYRAAGIINDVHPLSYDGQGRIIKDSSLSGSGFVTHYSYPNNNIASTVLFDGTPLNNQVDTLFMTNGNIGSERDYFPNNAGTADSLEGNVQVGYASIANPGYHAAIAGSVGPLLFTLQFDGNGNFMDFISKNAFNKVTVIGSGLPSGTSINYNLTTDSKGRLSQLTANLGGITGRVTFNYY